jgi:hypothetical protein
MLPSRLITAHCFDNQSVFPSRNAGWHARDKEFCGRLPNDTREFDPTEPGIRFIDIFLQENTHYYGGLTTLKQNVRFLSLEGIGMERIVMKRLVLPCYYLSNQVQRMKVEAKRTIR